MRRIQRSVGLASFLVSLALVAVNSYSAVVGRDIPLGLAVLHPSIWLLTVNAVAGLLSALILRPALRLVQVLLFLSSATYAAAVSSPGNLTPAALLVYALLLALQYGLFVRSAVFHYVVFFLIYVGGLTAGIVAGNRSPSSVVATLLGTALFVYLMWIALGRQLHAYRTKAEITAAQNAELERLVGERTAELRRVVEEKSTLVQEIHHRVKNNLGIISGMLTLQADSAPSEEARRALEDVQNRIYAMALIHEELYSADSFSKSDLASYLHSLGQVIAESHGMDPAEVLELQVDEISLPVGLAIPCGMVLTECIMNSIKYAFPDGRSPKILITASVSDHSMLLRITDNGVGIPDQAVSASPPTFGLWLIRTLVERQLHGSLRLDTSDGTTWEATIPLARETAKTPRTDS